MLRLAGGISIARPLLQRCAILVRRLSDADRVRKSTSNGSEASSSSVGNDWTLEVDARLRGRFKTLSISSMYSSFSLKSLSGSDARFLFCEIEDAGCTVLVDVIVVVGVELCVSFDMFCFIFCTKSAFISFTFRISCRLAASSAFRSSVEAEGRRNTDDALAGPAKPSVGKRAPFPVSAESSESWVRSITPKAGSSRDAFAMLN